MSAPMCLTVFMGLYVYTVSVAFKSSPPLLRIGKGQQLLSWFAHGLVGNRQVTLLMKDTFSDHIPLLAKLSLPKEAFNTVVKSKPKMLRVQSKYILKHWSHLQLTK